MTADTTPQEELRTKLADYAGANRSYAFQFAEGSLSKDDFQANVIDDLEELTSSIIRLIERKVLEERLDEGAGVTILPDGTLWSLHGDGQPLEERIKVLTAQLNQLETRLHGSQEQGA